ncbi:L-aspartate oxidase [Jeotgalibacillus haloalkalitolerans]|uniref:L-aspartate oxidase n=1 Tax=Jeotgalibacillus haloalkalitolerans TaxID=3104292 RepID=A0ABU5KHN3_9BACL|nr:L-aspartate oxidase [Jeotgalibacillus sp. HH7-29]MDZ5710734.1 L-aspartate oxidase [Jeotgalibacillus sp. HH7-29]
MDIADVLIVGSGVAALQLAAELSTEHNVKILTKFGVKHSNSSLAQGGIAAAIGTGDKSAYHVTDTLEAGRFHNDECTVRAIVQEGPGLIHPFSGIFDRDQDGRLQLGLEGAHSRHRIVHSGGDATGKNLVAHLLSQMNPNVTVEENMFSYELLMNQDKSRCIGVKAKDSHDSVREFYGRHIVLATGGCGQLYSFTSNAETATGDGIAMAYLAGAEVADMEFIQFHPTLLHINGVTKGLISEAVRGEGAVLVNEDGLPVMKGVHPLGDLAPRHIVSQTIFQWIEKGQQVYLDISGISHFSERFPSISAMCELNGVQISAGRIPVAPGSHFLMGGIKTDLTGRTSIDGLYAIGEVACTGFHGANRLASNSLLEGLYQGKRLAQWISANPGPVPQQERLEIDQTVRKAPLPETRLLKERMMKRVGIVRSKRLLEEQKDWLNQFRLKEISGLDDYSIRELTTILMGVTAELITEAALSHTESRGGHFRSDFPLENPQWTGTTLIQKYKGEKGYINEYIKASLVH